MSNPQTPFRVLDHGKDITPTFFIKLELLSPRPFQEIDSLPHLQMNEKIQKRLGVQLDKPP